VRSILLAIVLGLGTWSGGLLAQTLTLDNTANSGLDDPESGADFVAGDSFSLVTTGAAHNAPVTGLTWQNGVEENGGVPWLAGYTDGNGDLTLTGTETASYIADYLEQWFVNGAQIGNDLEFAVIPVPTTLSVASAVLAAWPNTCTADGFYWGIAADVKYNILSVARENIATYVLMIPYEQGYWLLTTSLTATSRAISARFHSTPTARCTLPTTGHSTTYR
jgi:hypothetical protein